MGLLLPFYLGKDCGAVKIIIVGNGKVGFSLAQQLVRENHEVTVVDQREESLRRIRAAIEKLEADLQTA